MTEKVLAELHVAQSPWGPLGFVVSCGESVYPLGLQQCEITALPIVPIDISEAC